jgi:hypothetical protein
MVKLLAEAGEDRDFASQKLGGALHVGSENATNSCRVNVGNMERAGHTVMLNQRDSCLLGGGLAACIVLGLAANKGFVGFDNGIRLAAKATVGSAPSIASRMRWQRISVTVPTLRFDVRDGLGLVAEDRVGDVNVQAVSVCRIGPTNQSK